MADPRSISRDLNLQDQMDKDLLKKWNTIIPILKNHILSVEEISPVYAAKYKFDAHSLFKECFNISDEFIYPTIRVNGMDSPTDYNGKVLRFARLDPAILNKYYLQFTA